MNTKVTWVLNVVLMDTYSQSNAQTKMEEMFFSRVDTISGYFKDVVSFTSVQTLYHLLLVQSMSVFLCDNSCQKVAHVAMSTTAGVGLLVQKFCNLITIINYSLLQQICTMQSQRKTR